MSGTRWTPEQLAEYQRKRESVTIIQPHAPALDEKPCEQERELHDGFERWLRIHEAGPIPYVHSRFDRKSTIRKGTPDFIVMFGNTANHVTCVAIEFKASGGKLSADQESVIAGYRHCGVPVLVAYSVTEAIEFTREKLGL